MIVTVEVMNKYKERTNLVMYYDENIKIGTLIGFKADQSEIDGIMKWEVISIKNEDKTK